MYYCILQFESYFWKVMHHYVKVLSQSFEGSSHMTIKSVLTKCQDVKLEI